MYVNEVSQTFKDKIQDLQGDKKQTLKQSIDEVFDALHSDLSDFSSYNMTYDAAKLTLRLLNAMFNPFRNEIKGLNLTQNVELAAVILAHFMLASGPLRCERVNRECQDLVFHLVYGTLGIDSPNFKAFMRADLAPGRFAFLGFCLKRGVGEAASISDHLCGLLEDLVLNDKQPRARAERQAAFFMPFLATAGKDVAENKVRP